MQPLYHSRFVGPVLAALALLNHASGLRADDTWKDVTPSAMADANNQLEGVDYGNGVFVANAVNTDRATATAHAITFTSKDGTSWAEHDQTFAVGGRVRFANGKFYLFGSAPTQKIFSSADGANWTSVDDADSENAAVGIATGNGATVAARASGLSGPLADTLASDGVHWTGSAVPATPPYTALTGLTFGAGLFAITGAGLQGPFYFTSPDGKSWTTQPGLSYGRGYAYITYGNGTFLAQQNGPSQEVSADGLTWTTANPGLTQTIPGAGTIGLATRFARFLNGQFIGVGGGSYSLSLYSSADAQNWTPLTTLPATQSDTQDVSFGGGRYVAVTTRNIYTDAAGGTTAPVKKADLAVTFSDVKTGPNAKGTKTKFKGTLTVTNSGKKPAADVKVAAYLSNDQTFSAASDTLISQISLADLGFPTLAKKGGTTGALPVKFAAKPADLGATSGKYLLVVVDPQGQIDDGDRSNNVAVYGPLP